MKLLILRLIPENALFSLPYPYESPPPTTTECSEKAQLENPGCDLLPSATEVRSLRKGLEFGLIGFLKIFLDESLGFHGALHKK